jgi:hypothetical protein
MTDSEAMEWIKKYHLSVDWLVETRGELPAWHPVKYMKNTKGLRKQWFVEAPDGKQGMHRDLKVAIERCVASVMFSPGEKDWRCLSTIRRRLGCVG